MLFFHAGVRVAGSSDDEGFALRAAELETVIASDLRAAGARFAEVCAKAQVQMHLCGLGADADSDPRPGPVPSCLARSMPARESVQCCLFMPQLPLAKMFVACPGPSWPAAPPCGLPARGRECRKSVQIRAGTVVSSTMNVLFKVVIASQIVVVLVRQLILRRLPLPLAKAVRSAGHDMAEDVRGMRVPVRAQRHLIKAFLDGSAGLSAMHTPSFLVVTGPQGSGKSTMLKHLLAEYHDEERLVLPVVQSLNPGQNLRLEALFEDVLQIKNFPDYSRKLPLMGLMKELKGFCMRKFQRPLIVYVQLSTKNRGEKFTMDQCDDVASELGGFARTITYDYALCQFVLEVSVSLIADKIQERLGQNRASRVLPRCCNSG